MLVETERGTRKNARRDDAQPKLVFTILFGELMSVRLPVAMVILMEGETQLQAMDRVTQ